MTRFVTRAGLPTAAILLFLIIVNILERHEAFILNSVRPSFIFSPILTRSSPRGSLGLLLCRTHHRRTRSAAGSAASWCWRERESTHFNSSWNASNLKMSAQGQLGGLEDEASKEASTIVEDDAPGKISDLHHASGWIESFCTVMFSSPVSLHCIRTIAWYTARNGASILVLYLSKLCALVMSDVQSHTLGIIRFMTRIMTCM